MRKFISIILSAVLIIAAFSVAGCNKNTFTLPEGNTFDFTRSQLAGTDALGREIMSNTGSDDHKYVGIRYLTLISEVGGIDKIYNTAELLDTYGTLDEWIAEHGDDEESIREYARQHPLFNRDPSNTIAPNSKHFWIDEPLYGYYSNCDPWVIARQMMLLGYMDIDYILIDLSNYPFYFTDATNAVLTVMAEMKDAGYDIPGAAFFLPQNALYCDEMLNGIWNYYLSKRAYRDVWFVGDSTINPGGGPLVVGNWASVIASDWEDRVWLKESQWPNVQTVTEDAIPWIDWGDYQRNHNGIMSVSPAQHIGYWSSQAYLFRDNGAGYHGRGWTYGDTTTGYQLENVLAGTNFQQQWDWVMKQGNEVDDDEIYMVLVSEWNEWTARKLGLEEPGAETSWFAPLVDEFDMTYSRSVEMMDGGYGDNYTFQLAQNIRNFKGLSEMSFQYTAVNDSVTIDIKDLTSWDQVKNIYMDYAGFISERNYVTADTGIRYKDSTNRNDISSLQIANDSQYLYIKVECLNDITAYKDGDDGWMNLYISTGAEGGWENYNYIVNTAPSNGKTNICKLSADTAGNRVETSVGTVDYTLNGKNIVYKIRLADLGAGKDTILQIKATDNVAGEGAFKVCNNAWDFYITGDSAPAGRLNYAYRTA